jgi:hypothetical protein
LSLDVCIFDILMKRIEHERLRGRQEALPESGTWFCMRLFPIPEWGSTVLEFSPDFRHIKLIRRRLDDLAKPSL